MSRAAIILAPLLLFVFAVSPAIADDPEEVPVLEESAPDPPVEAVLQPDLTSGDPDRGRALYSSSALSCSVCHGPNAQGFIGPRLANTSLTFEDMLDQLRVPRQTMAPFPPATLSDEDARSIYAFLKSLP